MAPTGTNNTNTSNGTSILNVSGGEYRGDLSIRAANIYKAQMMEAGTNSAPSLFDRYSTTTGLYFPSPGEIAMALTGVESFKLETGKVGFFTDSPTRTFNVLGGVTTEGGGAAVNLDYDAETGNFGIGLVLTGGTSGATGVIDTIVDNGTTGTLTLSKVIGTFLDNETITDTGTGSATADGTVSGTFDAFAQFENNVDIYSDMPKIGLEFKGKVNVAGTTSFLGGIQVGKENDTDGSSAGYVAIFPNPPTGVPTESARFSSGKGFYLVEVSTSDNDLSGWGQFWIKDDAPNKPKFTDDAGTDFDNTVSNYSVANVTNPPTDAELDSAFGDPTVLGPHFIGILDDNDAGTNVYMCTTTGTAGEWFYTLMTKAV